MNESIADSMRKILLGGKMFFVPPIPMPPSEMKNFVVYVSHEQIFDSLFTKDDLKASLEGLSLTDCLLTLSKIAVVLENDRPHGQKLQDKLRDGLVPPRYSSRIRKIQEAKDDIGAKIVFFDQQVLALAKYAFLYADNILPNNFENGNRRADFFAALLGVTDIFGETYDRATEGLSNEEQNNVLLGTIISNAWFNSSEDELSAIVRYYDMFTRIAKLPGLLDDPDYLDIEAIFEKATSVSLTHYMTVLVLIWFHFLPQSIMQDKFDLGREVINSEVFYKRLKIPKRDMERIFTELSSTIAETKAELEKEDIESSGFEWDYLCFRKKPLIRIDKNIYLLVSLAYLKDKMASGIYWMIFDYLKNTGGKKGLLKFTRFFGKIFERYVQDMLSSIFPSSNLLPRRLFLPQSYPVGRNQYAETSDAIIDYGDALVLLECENKRIKAIQTAIPGDLQEFDKDIEQLVVAGSKQLDRVIEDFKNNRFVLGSIDSKNIKLYCPIIISPESWPQGTIIWKRILNQINNEKLLQRNDISRVGIISIEELEILEYLAEQGENILEVLKEWQSHPEFKYVPLKNFLFFKDNPITPGRSKFMTEKSDRFYEQLNIIAKFNNSSEIKE